MILTESCHYNQTGHFRYLIHHHSVETRWGQGINSFSADFNPADTQAYVTQGVSTEQFYK